MQCARWSRTKKRLGLESVSRHAWSYVESSSGIKMLKRPQQEGFVVVVVVVGFLFLFFGVFFSCVFCFVCFLLLTKL